jgi:hypothetical protein
MNQERSRRRRRVEIRMKREEVEVKAFAASADLAMPGDYSSFVFLMYISSMPRERAAFISKSRGELGI